MQNIKTANDDTVEQAAATGALPGIMPDHWIREQSLNNGMIEPFVEKQTAQGKISFGLSSYGYDSRCSDEFKIFTNVDNAIVDPKDFSEQSFVDRKTDVFVAACSSFTNEFKNVAADQIARPAFMVDRYIPTDNFKLYTWERMHVRNAPATIYIGGDSFPQDYRGLKSDDGLSDKATPSNPVALHLASRDLSKNLAYLARPCQFLTEAERDECPVEYRYAGRYSRAVIDGYHQALDEMKVRYDLNSFHLVGYDGGVQIAGFLTAERQDVLSLRTVAGNLDHDFVAKARETESLSNSLNLKNIAPRIAHVPQHHFIGGADSLITPGVYHSFRQEMGPSSCVRYSLVQDADHTRGWVEKWPELLKLEPFCTGVKTQKEEPAPLPFEPYIPSRDAMPMKGK